MPFTLAHPAAILPFRRFCPRFLSFPALLVGSVIPDAGYWSGPLELGSFSHSFAGGFLFDLPAGLLMLAAIYLLRSPIERRLAPAYRELFEALWRRPLGSPVIVLFSLLVGIWTHLLWDSFTHNHGWLVERVPALQTTLFQLGSRSFRVSHLISYLCSFAGVAWLCVALAQWRRSRPGNAARALSKAQRRKMFLVASLVLPITAIHHLVPSLPGLCLVALLSLFMVAATIRTIGPYNAATEL